jgi:hypothetical protein
MVPTYSIELAIHQPLAFPLNNGGTITVSQEQEATGPGIVVLSSSLQVLHMNRRATDMLIQFERAAQSIGTERTVAAPLHQHCLDIMETFHARLGADNWEQFHQYRTIGDSTNSILLKGFALPDRRGLSHFRIVMLLFPHAQAPISGMRKMESSDRTFESDHVAGNSPYAIGHVSEMLPSSDMARLRS